MKCSLTMSFEASDQQSMLVLADILKVLKAHGFEPCANQRVRVEDEKPVSAAVSSEAKP